jgi:rubrerythrin
MNNLTNTETEKNLEAAFAGESMANRKYLYFAKLARELGNEEVAELFEETANQETGHAFAHLQLLELAIEGELYETNQMYPEFERIARQEGRLDAVEEFIEQADESREHAKVFTQAAKRFNSLGKVEEWHARRYQKALENLGEQSAESEQGEQKKSA